MHPSGKFLVIPNQYPFVKSSLASSTANACYAVTSSALRNTPNTSSLDAVIYPEQKFLVVKLDSPSRAGRNMILGALTGSLVVIVPAGFPDPTVDAPVGVPVGMEILGLPCTERKLLSTAAHIGALMHMRRMLVLTDGSVKARSYAAMPSVVPNRGNIPSTYTTRAL
jgi:hypothetical protein